MMMNTDTKSAKSDSGIKSSLAVNNMTYELPKSLTNSVASTTTKQQFGKRTYRSNETAECKLNTGSDFVCWDQTYLFFRVKLIAPTASVPANVKAGWGAGSALNLISEIKVSSRSGVEVDRLQRANFVNNVRNKWVHTKEFLESVGTLAGYSTSVVYDLNGATETAYCIPMSLILNFFRPKNDQPCPPQLASGLNVEILLAPVTTAVHEDISGELSKITDYELSDIFISTFTQTKQDSILRSVTQSSATTGLAYMFDKTYSTVNLGSSGSTALEIQINKAVSFAKRATIVGYLEADQTDITEDSFKTLGYPYTHSQFSVGSVYLPLQGLSSGLNSTYGSVLGYMYTQNAWQTRNKGNSVSYIDYASGEKGTSALSTTLEKSCDLELSGLSLNNSRSLNISLSFDSLSENISFLTFIDYQGVSNVFLNNVSSKE